MTLQAKYEKCDQINLYNPTVMHVKFSIVYKLVDNEIYQRKL